MSLKKLSIRIICTLFGHKFKVTRYVTDWTREVKCKRCKRRYQMDHYIATVYPLTEAQKKENDEIIENVKNFKSSL